MTGARFIVYSAGNGAGISGGEFWEGLVEIGDEVGGGFEADVQANDAVVVGRPAGKTAEVVSNSKTGYPAPTVADFEEFERIDEGVDLLLCGAGFENHGKDAGRAEEVALPEIVAGARVERGVQHAFDFGTSGEPPGDRERGGFDGRETHGESFEAA